MKTKVRLNITSIDSTRILGVASGNVTVAAYSDKGEIFVWRRNNWNSQISAATNFGRIQQLAVFSDQLFILAQGIVHVWNVNLSTPVKSLKHKKSDTWGMKVHKHYLFTLDTSDVVWQWDIRNLSLVRYWDPRQYIWSFCGNEDTLILSTGQEYNMTDGSLLYDYRWDNVYALDCTKDYIFYFSSSTSITQLDRKSRKKVYTYERHGFYSSNEYQVFAINDTVVSKTSYSGIIWSMKHPWPQVC